jgi:hypothetical protein
MQYWHDSDQRRCARSAPPATQRRFLTAQRQNIAASALGHEFLR